MTTLTLDTNGMRGLCEGRDITLDTSSKRSMATSVDAIVNTPENKQRLIALTQGAPLTNLTIIVSKNGDISARSNDGRMLQLATRVEAIARSFEPIKRSLLTPPIAAPAMPFTSPYAQPPISPPMMAAPAYPPQQQFHGAPPMMGPSAYPPQQHFHGASPIMGPSTYPSQPLLQAPLFHQDSDIQISAPLREISAPVDRRDELLHRQTAELRANQEKFYEVETEKLVLQNDILDLQIAPLQEELDKIKEELKGYDIKEITNDDTGLTTLITNSPVALRHVFKRARYRELQELQAQTQQAIKELELEKEFNEILMESSPRDRATRLMILELMTQDRDFAQRLCSAILPQQRQELLEDRIDTIKRLINNLSPLTATTQREGLESLSIQEHHDLLKLKKVLAELIRELATLKRTPTPAQRPHFTLPTSNLAADKAVLEAAYKTKLGDENPRTMFRAPSSQSDYYYLVDILNRLHAVEMELLDAQII